MRWTTAREAVRRVVPRDDRGVLIVLLAAGLLLRLAMMLAVRPISYGLNDSGTYLAAASGAGGASIFYDLHHAVGYAMYLDVIGRVVQTGFGLAVLQHLIGLGAGGLLFAAARNFGAPRWAAGIAAAAYLLNLDIVALEHSILSEATYIPLIALAVFAASRVYRAGRLQSVVLWAAVLGIAGALAYTMRYPGAAMFVLAVVAAVVLPRGPIRTRAIAGATAAVAVVAIVGAYLVAQDSATGLGWKLFPGQGWNAYTALAPTADCARFDPPPGTEALCQRPTERAGKTPEFYSWDGASPARRVEPRGFPYSDEKFAAFAEAAQAAQGGGDGGGSSLGPLAPIETRVVKVVRNAGVVLGSQPWASELDYQNLPVEQGERALAAGLLTLSPMTFHPPLQPLKDLRPFLRLSGPIALLSLLFVVAMLTRLGMRRALFCLIGIAVVLAWIDAGILPRYSVPIYLLSVTLFAIAAAGTSRGAAAPVERSSGARATAEGDGDRSQQVAGVS